MSPSPFQSPPFSRRRALLLAGGAALAAGGAPIRHLSAQGTPVAQSPTTPDLPMPWPPMRHRCSAPWRRGGRCDGASLVPGVAIGLLAGDREEHAIFGLASLSSMLPVTPETLFQVGSISKTHRDGHLASHR